jgi:hypothetical protein
LLSSARGEHVMADPAPGSGLARRPRGTYPVGQRRLSATELAPVPDAAGRRQSSTRAGLHSAVRAGEVSLGAVPLTDTARPQFGSSRPASLSVHLVDRDEPDALCGVSIPLYLRWDQRPDRCRLCYRCQRIRETGRRRS